jgi:hypothetical protein
MIPFHRTFIDLMTESMNMNKQDCHSIVINAIFKDILHYRI